MAKMTEMTVKDLLKAHKSIIAVDRATPDQIRELHKYMQNSRYRVVATEDSNGAPIFKVTFDLSYMED